jgi:hypothetical protein
MVSLSQSRKSVIQAIGRLYDRAIDSVLSTPYEVRTADEALAMIESEAGGVFDGKALADQVQMAAVLLTPMLRRVRWFERLPGAKKLPFIVGVATVANVAVALRRGVREVQIVSSYLVHRLREATGDAPDPTLVKVVAVQLYTDPNRRPVPGGRIAFASLLRRWLLRGVFGRDTQMRARSAVFAVAQLDIPALLADRALPSEPVREIPRSAGS